MKAGNENKDSGQIPESIVENNRLRGGRQGWPLHPVWSAKLRAARKFALGAATRRGSTGAVGPFIHQIRAQRRIWNGRRAALWTV